MQTLEQRLKKYTNNSQGIIRFVVGGYIILTILATLIFALPFARTEPILLADLIFMSSSIVSTTGLVSVDFGNTFSFSGQIISLVFIQLGGIGYMALASYIILGSTKKIPKFSLKLLLVEFHLPNKYPLSEFLYSVAFYTLLIETIGAIVLYFNFKALGLENPMWLGIFHSVSAFCTAGFSLFSTSFTEFGDNYTILNTIGVLSLLGSIGFIVFVDFKKYILGQRKHITLTSKIILVSTFLILLIGTFTIYLSEGNNITFINAMFQSMTAHTTVGFNSIPLNNLPNGAILMMIILMIIGASPSGTGGGVKTTSITALFGIVRSVLARSKYIMLSNVQLPAKRVLLAISTFIFYLVILVTATFILFIIEGNRFNFASILFETTSALSTVGLSLGISSDLSDLSKILVSILMFIGRIGVITFGLALVHEAPIMRKSPREEDIAI